MYRCRRVQLVTDDVLQTLGVGGMGAGERLEDEPDRLRRSLGSHLVVEAAPVGDLVRHVAGTGEELVVGIDDDPEGGALPRRLDQRAGIGLVPGALALLEQPEAGEVAQQPDTSVGTDLVGQSGPQRRSVQDGAGNGGTDEAPGS